MSHLETDFLAVYTMTVDMFDHTCSRRSIWDIKEATMLYASRRYR